MSAKGTEFSPQMSFRILVGMLPGPDILFGEIVRINFEISSRVTGFRFGLDKKEEKFRSDSGNLDRIVLATFEKYELNSHATLWGSELIISSILSDIGLAILEFLREIISLTPCQILRMLSAFELKYLVK